MKTFQRGPLEFEYIDAGPPAAAETIVLLHGFPEDAQSWRPVVDRLAGHGFRVLAPNQRGYSPGARPGGRAAYRLQELVGDVVALLDEAGVESAHVVGHDWGGGLGWVLGARVPSRVRSLTIVSTPHPRALVRSLLTSKQVLFSWYLFFFQLPAIPEYVMGRKNGAFGLTLLRRFGLAEPVARQYADRLLSVPGAMTGAINWYRALPLDLVQGLTAPAVAVPTLYVWSTGDVTVGRRAAELTRNWVSGFYRFEVLDRVSHWIPEEAPAVLTELIRSHVDSQVRSR